jgi:hypothetical protein
MGLIPFNDGLGPLRLSSVSGDARKRMYQIVLLRNGSHIWRPAGTYQYHPAHHHYHLKDFLSMRLFRVHAPGVLDAVATSTKIGFCLSDAALIEWFRFYQDPVATVRTDCTTPRLISMGLSTGWADIYPVATVGNYIAIRNLPNGKYVIRVKIDPTGRIMETNEDDNISYAVFLRRSKRIRVVERGYGRGPWDPGRQVVHEWWNRFFN